MRLQSLITAFLFSLAVCATPELAHAFTRFDESFCRIASIFHVTAEILGILGLCIFGIIMMLGKGTWGAAMLHLMAGAIFLGAGAIAEALGANASCPP